VSAPGKGAAAPTSDTDETPERVAVFAQLAEIAARGEEQRVEFETARSELDAAARTIGGRIIAAETGMRRARREFIRVLSLLAPGVTRLAYTSSRSPQVEARLRNDLSDALRALEERGVDTKVVLSEWLGGSSAADLNVWRPASLEFGETVNMAARTAAERRRQL
jgi:hypothetical protein